jgi:hypothetical protein
MTRYDYDLCENCEIEEEFDIHKGNAEFKEKKFKCQRWGKIHIKAVPIIKRLNK